MAVNHSAPQQSVMNAAARAIVNLSLHDHVKPELKELYTLATSRTQKCTYKLCLLMHLIHIGKAPPPEYSTDCVSHSRCSWRQMQVEVD